MGRRVTERGKSKCTATVPSCATAMGCMYIAETGCRANVRCHIGEAKIPCTRGWGPKHLFCTQYQGFLGVTRVQNLPLPSGGCLLWAGNPEPRHPPGGWQKKFPTSVFRKETRFCVVHYAAHNTLGESGLRDGEGRCVANSSDKNKWHAALKAAVFHLCLLGFC